ncbi:salicylate esterase [Actinoplanes philippinensis]|uniref:Pimeloyl-ACP methyl ester carboxylesterase n=1 Tax=Actinoplanes philippinensis TaxID=35752 RepID=A0A1I2I5W1_9ACTN|nr:alpha/beta hydrolase family protein [Actinoplanes philippinensis]GIE78585.1 salicylate esterase [Actinoplanes philippinensis]SFF37682.1 Pimeloyl-ACP methyl ester carboxylesterase [Actinoplanes philippinensis]
MHYVFIPGAWHGGWSWHPVGHRVRAAGHGATALTMPGLSLGDDPAGLRLADAVDHIVTAVERRDLRDVVLVGHSWGGIPITGAAHRLAARLAGIAYFSAFIPQRGESMAAAMGPLEGFVRDAIAAAPDGTIGIDFATFAQGLMPDQPEALQRAVFDQLMPQPGGYMLDAQDLPGVDTLGVPITYVLAENDTALAAPGAELAARVGAHPILVPGSHEALLTHPDDVAKALLAGHSQGSF